MNSQTLTTLAKVQAGQYNMLRSDALDDDIGHNHDGTNGVKIKYENLDWSDLKAPDGLKNSLKKIDDHVNQTGIYHGLPANTNMVGMYKSSRTSGFFLQSGYVHGEDNNPLIGPGGVLYGTTTFSTPYSSPPIVLTTIILHEGRGPGLYAGISIKSVTTTEFSWLVDSSGLNYACFVDGFYWISIGT